MLFKMVSTRSQEKKSEDKKGISTTSSTSNENENDKKKVQLKLANFLSKALTKKIKKEDDDGSSEEEYEEDDEIYDDDFTLPPEIENNDLLLNKANKVIEKIQMNKPDLKKILTANIRPKDRMELFELFFVYRYMEPNSEERLILKKEMREKLIQYKKVFIQTTKHKEKITNLEKKLSRNDELFELKSSILQLECDEESREYLYNKYLMLENAEVKDEEYVKMKLVLKEALKLPFQRCMEIPQDVSIMKLLKNVRDIFDQELYGMDNVKEQLMLFFNNKLCNPSIKGCCLGLVGPAGVGKTTIAHCLAKILKLPFQQIPLGGLSTGESMKGHDSTYIGSRPGQIARSMMQLGHKNGILFLDEFDKISNNIDIVNSMLHITDFTQNHQFRDNFFGELNIDLSSLWFICSMNEKPQNEILSDRIYFIDVDGYSFQDKKNILKNYVIPKIIKQMNKNTSDFEFTDEILAYFIRKFDNENNKGIRLIQSKMQDFMNKLIFLHSTQNEIKMSFSLPKEYFPMNLPIKIDEKILNVLLKDSVKPINPSFANLYI